MSAKVNTWLAFEHHWRIWKICGLVPPRLGSALRAPYFAITVLFNIATNILMPITFIVACFDSANLDELFENLYITITLAFCNLKYVNVIGSRNKLRDVRPIIERLDERAQTATEIAALRQAVTTSRRGVIIVNNIFCFSILTGYIIMFSANERILLYRVWLPWDSLTSSFKYAMSNAYLTIGFIIIAMQDAASDMYPQAYLYVLAAHIKTLTLRVRRLSAQPLIRGRRRRAPDEEEEEAFKQLIACIKDHQRINKLFITIRTPLQTTCMLQFICTALAQCTVGVYIFTVSDYSKIAHVVVFFSIITLETYILCYYGEVLCQESENLSANVYACNWTDRSERFKKTLLLMLQRSQKLNMIMAGTLVPLRLPTFVSVMKTAYSIFTVLNKFK